MDKEKKEPILVNGEEVGEGLVEQELHMLRERYAREMSHQEMEENQAKIESDARENAVDISVHLTIVWGADWQPYTMLHEKLVAQLP